MLQCAACAVQPCPAGRIPTARNLLARPPRQPARQKAPLQPPNRAGALAQEPALPPLLHRGMPMRFMRPLQKLRWLSCALRVAAASQSR
jgi:hypothetical protein